jgi:hypothetical protein
MFRIISPIVERHEIIQIGRGRVAARAKRSHGIANRQLACRLRIAMPLAMTPHDLLVASVLSTVSSTIGRTRHKDLRQQLQLGMLKRTS